MSSLQRQMMSSRLPVPPGTRNLKLPPNKDLSPLPWNDFFEAKRIVEVDGASFNVYLAGQAGPIFLLLHGGGYSGLTWSCFAKELQQRIECRIVAPDLRGHGDTSATDEDDLSSENQVKDITDVFNSIYGDNTSPVCIIGHSMGGALAIRVAHAGGIKNVVGLTVIDVVEGSAMEALAGMVIFLRNRPTHFDSIDKAIQWCLKSGTARNSTSARVSMPSQIRKVDGDERYEWRINLERTERHWAGWFEGLSAMFLSCSPPKLLVLAGIDRLDKDLMIGQMQGKFQNIVLPKVGHAVQEDSPDRLADEVARFAIRYRFATSKTGTTPKPTVMPCC